MKKFILENKVQEDGGVSVHYRSPGVMGLMANNVILMWVVAEKVLDARWRRVWVRKEDWVGHGRSILLVIRTCLFLCSSSRKRRLGKWDACAMSNQSGLSRWWLRSG